MVSSACTIILCIGPTLIPALSRSPVVAGAHSLVLLTGCEPLLTVLLSGLTSLDLRVSRPAHLSYQVSVVISPWITVAPAPILPCRPSSQDDPLPGQVSIFFGPVPVQALRQGAGAEVPFQVQFTKLGTLIRHRHCKSQPPRKEGGRTSQTYNLSAAKCPARKHINGTRPATMAMMLNTPFSKPSGSTLLQLKWQFIQAKCWLRILNIR